MLLDQGMYVDDRLGYVLEYVGRQVAIFLTSTTWGNFLYIFMREGDIKDL